MPRHNVIVSPRLADIDPKAYHYATMCSTQAEANEWLEYHGLPPVRVEPAKKKVRVDKPQDVGVYSLDLCQGGARYVDWHNFKDRPPGDLRDDTPRAPMPKREVNGREELQARLAKTAGWQAKADKRKKSVTFSFSLDRRA